MILFRDLVKFLACLSAVIVFIITYGSKTVDLFVSWGIISVADGKITIVPFANYMWYILGLSVLIVALLCLMGYKYFTEGLSFGVWPYFLMWLAYVLLVVYGLAKPVPWYGLAFGLFGLFVLFWIMFRAIFPPDFSKSKA
jgi:hypothetical protein